MAFKRKRCVCYDQKRDFGSLHAGDPAAFIRKAVSAFVNVAKEAGKLAEKYGADVEKAVTAGILHDIMKDTPPAEQLKFMQQWGIILSDVEKTRPNCIMHVWGRLSGT